ncbi:MAG: hypothetical protein IPP06_05305 [Saprospiraceae bacterium]|nr:hypothetical protein [Candidatus Vicinibacter affinis]
MLGLGIVRDTFIGIPTKIGIKNDYTLISKSIIHCLALDKSGSLWSWGNNDHGSLGNNPYFQHRSSPALVGAPGEWTYSNAGGSWGTRNTNSMAIKRDGSLWAWGEGASNQLSDITKTRSNIPVPIGSENDWIKCEAGSGVMFAIKNDNSIWAWGKTITGKLGLGENKDVVIPTNLCCKPKSKVTQLSACEGDTIKLNGNLLYQGKNIFVDTIPIASICDSIAITEVVFNKLDTTLYHDTLCNDDLLFIDGIKYSKNTTSGYSIKSKTLAPYCDSVVKINLTFLDSLNIKETFNRQGGTIGLKINTYGGLPPYYYDWSTGESADSLTINSDGEYVITITDSKGCQFVKNLLYRAQRYSKFN